MMLILGKSILFSLIWWTIVSTKYSNISGSYVLFQLRISSVLPKVQYDTLWCFIILLRNITASDQNVLEVQSS